MDFSPILTASPAVQIHVVCAILAFLLGGVVLFRRKGDRLHRIGGRLWVALMLIVCISSLFIHMIRMFGAWSPIHLLSIGTLAALAWGVWVARARRIPAHRRVMQVTYVGALIIAGIFTFMPGRKMFEVFFEGEQPMVGVAVLATMVLGGAALTLRGRRPTQRPSRHLTRAAA